IFENTPDSVWIGAENGATLWDGQDHLTNYTSADGLTGKRITAFFKDKNQQLWAFSDAYLHHWKNQKWQAIKSLTFQKTPEGRVYDVAYDARHHRVLVASTTGAFVLDLNKIQLMSNPIPLVIESVESKIGVLDRSKVNVLDASNNSIRIHFSLPSYTRTKANECYFRLVENGDNWNKANPNTTFQFENLSWGTYTLQALSINPDGLQDEIKTITKFKILAPLWLRWWAILLEVILGIALVGGVVAWYFQQKNKKRLAALQLERELQTERERISRDLHDNIGAQLTNITYRLDLAAHQSEDENDAQKIEDISGETRNTMKLLRDTIWALQKDEFSIQDLANKIQSYVQRLEGIEMVFNVQTTIEEDWTLSSKEVLHLFRIGQEAIQNMIKHAEASEATISFQVKPESYELQFIDNGKGFVPLASGKLGHYGLENMNFRAKEIGAHFSIEKHGPNGTCVRIHKHGQTTRVSTPF
ncbi:MAG: histidine kinase, partial [Bacteroidota bacterium]